MMDNGENGLYESSELFECAACGMFYRIGEGVNECPRCKRVFCKECIEGNGLCLSCQEEHNSNLPLAP